MLLELLDAKHPHYDGDYIADLDALYSGGRAFRAKITKFLPQNPQEPGELYALRQREAHYRSYLAAVIDYYTSWLFSAGFSLKALSPDTGEPAEVDPYYNALAEDADYHGCDLVHFMRERTRRALIDGKSHWLLEKPSNEGEEPEDRLEYEVRDLGRISLHCVDAFDLWDWEYDEEGDLVWCTIHSISEVRPSPLVPRNQIVETWRIYDRTEVSVFELRYEKGQRPRDPLTSVKQTAGGTHGFDFVPLMSLCLPDGMWIADKVASAQIEHFRVASALAWLIRRTCYAMPVLNLESTDSVPTHGAGYYIAIGLEEKFNWASPSNTPFDVLGKEVDKQREEIFRITHQLALGLSNNADTVGRSADSKEFDVAATRVMLNAYGQIISASIEKTLDAISRGRGDTDLKWSIEGFNGFDTATAAQLLAAVKMAKDLGIPSKTFHKEANTKAALAILPDINDHSKNAIREEISAAAESMETGPAQDPAHTVIEKQKAETELAKAQAVQAKRPQPVSKPFS